MHRQVEVGSSYSLEWQQETNTKTLIHTVMLLFTQAISFQSFNISNHEVAWNSQISTGISICYSWIKLENIHLFCHVTFRMTKL